MKTDKDSTLPKGTNDKCGTPRKRGGIQKKILAPCKVTGQDPIVKDHLRKGSAGGSYEKS